MKRYWPGRAPDWAKDVAEGEEEEGPEEDVQDEVPVPPLPSSKQFQRCNSPRTGPFEEADEVLCNASTF